MRKKTRIKYEYRWNPFSKALYVMSQTLKMVWSNLVSDALRSFMTCLGIIIGTSSLIIMMSMMDLRFEKSARQIDEKGMAEIRVDIYEDSLSTGLLQEHIDGILNIEHVANISPIIEGKEKTTIQYGDKSVRKVNVKGISEAYYSCSLMESIINGNPFTASDVKNENKVCVISRKLAMKLFGNTSCVNKRILLMGVSFNIKGVSLPADADTDEYNVFIPYTLMRKMTGNGIYIIKVYSDSHEYVNDVDMAVRSYMDNLFHAYGENDYYSDYYYYGLLKDEEDRIRNAAHLQMIIAGIALTIGGIGIMNMMLVMVSERTTEIGLRKALGSSKGRIQLQFVMESIFISLAGGLIGVLFGVVISLLYSFFTEGKLHVNIPSAFVGLFFCMAVGVFFGWSPAKAASELQPIDALKGE